MCKLAVLATPGAAVIATCARCNKSIYIERSVLTELPEDDLVIDLEKRVRCRCGQRGGTVWIS